jgi:hypothetical protein
VSPLDELPKIRLAMVIECDNDVIEEPAKGRKLKAAQGIIAAGGPSDEYVRFLHIRH